MKQFWLTSLGRTIRWISILPLAYYLLLILGNAAALIFAQTFEAEFAATKASFALLMTRIAILGGEIILSCLVLWFFAKKVAPAPKPAILMLALLILGWDIVVLYLVVGEDSMSSNVRVYFVAWQVARIVACSVVLGFLWSRTKNLTAPRVIKYSGGSFMVDNLKTPTCKNDTQPTSRPFERQKWLLKWGAILIVVGLILNFIAAVLRADALTTQLMTLPGSIGCWMLIFTAISYGVRKASQLFVKTE